MDNKYFNSKSVELKRSQINPASYNPRTISDEGKKALKRSIKLYGVVGGIVVNQATGYTIVGGHQKVAVLDELNKYDKSTHENDYTLRVELINVDEKTEKQLNITLNNPNVGGNWDFDALARIVPDIDWKDAGLTDADLNMIGVDYLLQTEEESSIADALSDMMASVTEQKEAEKAAKRLERAEKVAHMKEVKQQVKENAQKQAENMDAYVMLSFNTYEAKAAFCERFGYDGNTKFLKGEVFDEQVERID
ncbi:DNA methylase [Phocaeicola vulgatus]|jgi:ParB-like chromosome segregation protein Spo0J|uniref:DNA methylase n=2 Tax=Phocaeicola TaxID=909656 RepID=A0A6I1A4B1_PHOVU|nr:ParB/RepB/Spo0J family partition protein [Phocaeicola vulgatus]KAB6445336.1 DNA methylase [Phocaeicola vulgatus]KAB6466017.1 DNA methylase [Phocaeicola vulgatus]KAB6467324.1 DNA methylase [Phocaeicola vulgatus]KAB6471364.1 DNA methylase [Phocaeicola vulgatus]KAB6478950.1 DNA methylase [Phocaeicola vulgatus]